MDKSIIVHENKLVKLENNILTNQIFPRGLQN